MAHPIEHGLEAGAALGVQRPGDVAGGGLQVLEALPAGGALGLLEEGVVGGADALQEQVVAVQELAVALQQEHRDGQHAAQHVQEAVAQLCTPRHACFRAQHVRLLNKTAFKSGSQLCTTPCMLSFHLAVLRQLNKTAFESGSPACTTPCMLSFYLAVLLQFRKSALEA